MVENPAYIGVWKAKQIPNPDYYSDEDPLQNIGKVSPTHPIDTWLLSIESIYPPHLATEITCPPSKWFRLPAPVQSSPQRFSADSPPPLRRTVFNIQYIICRHYNEKVLVL